MRTFSLIELDPTSFDEFSAGHPQGNFQQSSRMGADRANRGIEVSYLGVLEKGAERGMAVPGAPADERLVAATLFEVYKNGLATFAEIHDGPLADLRDQELTSFLFGELRRRAHKAGAAQLEVTPEIPYRACTSDGAPLPETGELPAGVPAGSPRSANDEVIENLKRLGFAHGGFTRGYTAVPRWRYLKDLTGIADEKALLASYAKNTKRNVRIAETSGVRVRNIGRDELHIFHALCEMSCEKQGFENHELAYYEELFDAFGDGAEFKVAFIDTAAYLAEWEQKRDGFAADIAKLERSLATARTPEKVEKKLADVRSKHEASLRRVESARELTKAGEQIPAAAAMFAWHPRECVYLFSGSDPDYAKFYAATAIQHRIMVECLERGCTRYNFYGINGVFDDPNDPGRGLVEFKQGFNGYVEEMCGSFTLVVRPGLYAAKRFAHKVLGR